MGGEKLGSCPSSLFLEVGRETPWEDVCVCVRVCVWVCVCRVDIRGGRLRCVCVNQEEEAYGRDGLGVPESWTHCWCQLHPRGISSPDTVDAVASSRLL